MTLSELFFVPGSRISRVWGCQSKEVPLSVGRGYMATTSLRWFLVDSNTLPSLGKQWFRGKSKHRLYVQTDLDSSPAFII